MACCGNAVCNCKVVGGPGVGVTGTGTPDDPFVLSGDMNLAGTSNAVFQVAIGGSGSDADPWTLSVDFAPSAKLGNVPDVNVTSAADGQVLAWQASSKTWIPVPPVTAQPGAINHDTTLTGDGSNVDPLGVALDSNRGMSGTLDGIGLDTATRNQLVRKYASAAARTADTPNQVLNTVTVLNGRPGQYEWWDGADWSALQTFDVALVGTTAGAMMELSGPYVPGMRLTLALNYIDETTAPGGEFSMLAAGHLAGYRGVLVATFTRTGDASVPRFVHPYADAPNSRIRAQVFDVNGDPTGAVVIRGWVTAWLY